MSLLLVLVSLILFFGFPIVIYCLVRRKARSDIKDYNLQESSSILVSIDDGEKTRLLNVYLEEYKNIRAEVLARIQTQNQAYNYVVIIVAAALTAIIASFREGVDLSAVVNAIMLFLPLITAPFAFVFFDNEIMFHAIGSLMAYDRQIKIASLVNDKNVLANIHDFKHMEVKPDALFNKISFFRYLLFFIPTFLPILFLTINTIEIGFHYRILIESAKTTVEFLSAIIFTLDLICFGFLIQAVCWLYESRKSGVERWKLRRALEEVKDMN